MVRAHEWDVARRLGHVPASRRPWWAAHRTVRPVDVLEWESAGAEGTLLVTGDLDARTAGRLEGFVAERLRPGAVLLTVELSGARSVGSAGLGALLSLRRWCDQRGVQLRVRGALPSVWRSFEAVGVAGAFVVVGEPVAAGEAELVLF
jgi:anti-sigma B factor antagonist